LTIRLAQNRQIALHHPKSFALPKQNSVDLEQFFGPQKMEKRLNVGLRNKYTRRIVGTA
jgi:hypothetical protein